MEQLEAEPEETPLQKKLEHIAEQIGILGTIAAGLTVAVLFIRFFIEQSSLEGGLDFGNKFGIYLTWWF